ncbi:MAG: hypothetical protein JNJ85_05855 [Candidatus Kapabacteria bacterium]|nr:hypothetical protein [Candidatus Kapabacteria bacterium]MBX7156634.1 hypothetical protein [Bacteroidota bacterium]
MNAAIIVIGIAFTYNITFAQCSVLDTIGNIVKRPNTPYNTIYLGIKVSGYNCTSCLNIENALIALLGKTLNVYTICIMQIEREKEIIALKKYFQHYNYYVGDFKANYLACSGIYDTSTHYTFYFQGKVIYFLSDDQIREVGIEHVHNLLIDKIKSLKAQD